MRVTECSFSAAGQTHNTPLFYSGLKKKSISGHLIAVSNELPIFTRAPLLIPHYIFSRHCGHDNIRDGASCYSARCSCHSEAVGVEKERMAAENSGIAIGLVVDSGGWNVTMGVEIATGERGVPTYEQTPREREWGAGSHWRRQSRRADRLERDQGATAPRAEPRDALIWHPERQTAGLLPSPHPRNSSIDVAWKVSPYHVVSSHLVRPLAASAIDSLFVVLFRGLFPWPPIRGLHQSGYVLRRSGMEILIQSFRNGTSNEFRRYSYRSSEFSKKFGEGPPTHSICIPGVAEFLLIHEPML